MTTTIHNFDEAVIKAYNNIAQSPERNKAYNGYVDFKELYNALKPLKLSQFKSMMPFFINHNMMCDDLNRRQFTFALGSCSRAEVARYCAIYSNKAYYYMRRNPQFKDTEEN